MADNKKNPAAAASQNPTTLTVTKTEHTAAIVTASPNIYLETSKAEEKEEDVWLLKCPAVVSRSFHQQQQKKFPSEQSPHQFINPSASLATAPMPHLISSHNAANQHNDPSYASSDGRIAKVIVSVNPLLPEDDPKYTEFTMELAGTESENVPKIYSMDKSTDFVPMAAFSESSQGKLSMEGKICHKFDMKPRGATIQDYGRLCRERTRKCMTKTRQVQVLGNDGGMHIRPMLMVTTKSSGTLEKNKTPSKMPLKVSELKRTRRSRDEMEQIMFKLFERQPNWTLKKLIQTTDQPEQFVKEMLKLLCVYNNKGSNQGTYELKPEYKQESMGNETVAD